jgi:hypothetical protein
MAENEKETAALPAYDFKSGNITILLVGYEERKMVVHSPQITAHSEFFTAALKKEWAEGQTREIKLPEEEPEIMAHYIEYVYFNKLPTDIYTTASPGLAKRQGYKILAQIYVLAERLLDSNCRNRILREVLRLRILKCAKDQEWNPTWVPVNIIYQGTMPGSPARRLLVDIHASVSREDWYSSDTCVDPSFSMDLARKLLRNVESFKTVREFRQLALKAEDYRV